MMIAAEKKIAVDLGGGTEDGGEFPLRPEGAEFQPPR